jgi:IclR family pca regulon transcriptional regulator
MSITLMPGSRLPAFCTSMGRVLLAALPRAEAGPRLEAAPRMRRTRYTTTAVELLLAELETVRAQGFALIDQEVELGLRSIAIPLVNARGTIVAAMNIGVAAGQHDIGELASRYLEPMRAVQRELRPLLR